MTDLPEPPDESDVTHPWMEVGLEDLDYAYSVTVIHHVDPDEALRRYGIDESRIITTTWAELQLAREDSVVYRVVAAFGLGPHTLIVEDGGEGASQPELSEGTFAVSSYCSINADQLFLVSRDGQTLAEFDEGLPSGVWGAEPWVIEEALAVMGIDDPNVFDEDDAELLDDLELLCQLAEVRPTVADVAGPARAILE
ncbi:DUF6461 domain-containing protein [Nocardia callitridis]|uniref:tRNA adenosine deaminase-associated protein n=1 Tax=Nocardia callitridis TaxID=648753 RepID=A0ABP9KLB5_9NOCA